MAIRQGRVQDGDESEDRTRFRPLLCATTAVAILSVFSTPAAAQLSSACTPANVLCVDDTAGSTQEFPTIQAAANAVQPGDTVLVHAGNYSGFRVTRSGTVSAPIAFRASGTVNISSSSSDGIYLSRVSYVTIEGFQIASVAQRCIAARDASANNPVRGVVIRGNTCTGARREGLYLSQVSESLVENNTIRNLSGSRGHAIYLSNAGSDNTIVRRNTIHDITGRDGAGIHMNGDSSVGGDGIISGVVLDSNIIYNVRFNGISMDGVQNTTVQNNVIYAVSRSGVRAFRIDGGGGPRNLRFINNTMHLTSSGGGPVKISEDLGGHVLFNNILLADSSSVPSVSIANVSGLRSDYNIVSNRMSRGSSNVTLSQWQGYGFDGNSVVASASTLFAAPGSDYSLRSGTPAVNTGVAAFAGINAPAADRLNTARPHGAAFDRGAHELRSGSGGGGGGAGDTTDPTVTLTSPSPRSTVSGTAVTIGANASDNTGVMGVQFRINGSNVGSEDPTSPYSVTWNTTQHANGSYQVTAVARDAVGNTAVSPAVTVTVSNSTTPPPPPTQAATATSLSSSVNPSQAGQPVTFTAAVSPSAATGSVRFYSGASLIGTAALSSGRASVSTSSLPAGSHTIRATYGGNAAYASSSSTLTQNVRSSGAGEGDCASRNVLCVDDTGGATQEYSTIQAAANAAIAGDTVLVHPGTYRGFRVSDSGVSNAPITYKAQGEVLINTPDSSGTGIYLSRVSYVTIEGFTIRNASRRCIAAHDASATSPVRGLIIRGNNCSGAGIEGIYVSQVADSLVENNTIFGLRGSRGHGIYLANAGSDRTTVRGNVIYDIRGSEGAGIHMNGDRSVGGEGIITDVLLDGNIIYDTNFNGVSMDGVQDTTLRNNVIFRVGRHAVRAFRIDGGAGPGSLRFINNSFHTTRGWAIRISEDLGGHRIFNNVLLSESSSGGSISIGTTSGFDSSNNAVVNRFSWNDESSIQSLAQWQSSGYESNSFVTTAGAVFANPSGNDYRARTGSPLIDKGLASFNGIAAPSAAHDGTPRPRGAAVDIGAYEQ